MMTGDRDLRRSHVDKVTGFRHTKENGRRNPGGRSGYSGTAYFWPSMRSSVRRLSWRPASVSFGATGIDSP